MAKMSNRGPTKRFLISEMDRSVKRMMKLIEEEGDSFAKKAEIYIQKRPELVNQVEDFYRMFRALAERYDDATCELRRTLPPDVRTQGCGMSEICSEPPSAITSPEHRSENRQIRRFSGAHTAYFDVIGNKGYETSAYDSGSDQDDSFYNNYPPSSNYGNYRRLRRKITELEGELRKVQIEQEVNRSNTNIAYYEEELRIAKEKIRSSEEEICNLKSQLEKYESFLFNENFSDESINRIAALEQKLGGAEEDVRKLRQELVIDDLTDEDETEDETEQLRSERDEFAMRISELEEEMKLKDDQIDELNNRLEKLHLECEKSSKSIAELEKMIEKQRELIEEGAEEKLQTERQLFISLEHYRNAYQMLRKGLLDQKKPVMAS